VSSDAAAPLLRTPLFDEHRALGGRMVPFAGWEMPVQYAGVSEEHKAVRTAAGLFDVSHMGEMLLSGEHAGAVVDYLITNDASRLVDGQALYTCACKEDGGILDDLIVYRIDQTHWLVVCNAGNRDKMVAHFRRAAENHCEFEDASDRTALLALQGPKAVEIVSAMVGDGALLSGLGSFRFSDAHLAGIKCTAARTGYTGEDGFEIFCAPTDAPALFRALLDAGKPFGLVPAGLAARDTLRLEARLSLYGNDIDETTNPIEAGLGWVVKLDKALFVGKDALAKVKAEGPSRKIVGFEMVGRGIARHGYPLLDGDGKTIGVCTSGSPSPTTGKSIGLGYVPAAMATIGTKLFVDCRGKAIEAVVARTPFYKRTS
jgi:aminomethyltransferase